MVWVWVWVCGWIHTKHIFNPAKHNHDPIPKNQVLENVEAEHQAALARKDQVGALVVGVCVCVLGGWGHALI